MRREVAGLYFSPDLSRVALVRRGGLYCIGGLAAPHESPETAIVRTFEEQTGLRVEGWRWFLELTDSSPDPLSRVDIYAARAPLHAHLFALRNPDAEAPIVVVPTDRLPDDVLYRLHWIVPMAMDPDVASAWVRDQGRAA